MEYTYDGKQFIGRTKQLSELKNKLALQRKIDEQNERGVKGSCSVIGPIGIGKTALVNKAISDYMSGKPENTFYINVLLTDVTGGENEESNFVRFWKIVVKKFASEITDEYLKRLALKAGNIELHSKIMDVYAAFGAENDGAAVQIEQISTNKDAISSIETLFDSYRKLGIRVILAIDKFDYALKLFPKSVNEVSSEEIKGAAASFFNTLFKLSFKSDFNAYLSVVLIARRHMDTISHSLKAGSDFRAAFPAISLSGYTNSELTTYFSTYKPFPGDGMLQAIVYYCGRHPGLLDVMRGMIENYLDVSRIGTSKNVKRQNEMQRRAIVNLFNLHGDEITAIYDGIARLLKEEYVEANAKKNGIGTIAQAFIGPAYEEKVVLKKNLKILYKYGLLTRVETYTEENKDEDEVYVRTAETVFELAGMKDDEDKDYKYQYDYEPLAPYFIDYLSENVLVSDGESVHGLLRRTERDIRKVITNVYKEMYGDIWKDKLAEEEHHPDWLNQVSIQAAANRSEVEYSAANGMDFRQYGAVIEKNWDKFKKYFSSYIGNEGELFSALKKVITTPRNFYAHNNEEILNADQLQEYLKFCERVLKDIQNGLSGKVNEVLLQAGTLTISAGSGAAAATASNNTSKVSSLQQQSKNAPNRVPAKPKVNLRKGDIVYFLAEKCEKQVKNTVVTGKVYLSDTDANPCSNGFMITNVGYNRICEEWVGDGMKHSVKLFENYSGNGDCKLSVAFRGI